jgi:hypothetical protein
MKGRGTRRETTDVMAVTATTAIGEADAADETTVRAAVAASNETIVATVPRSLLSLTC